MFDLISSCTECELGSDEESGILADLELVLVRADDIANLLAVLEGNERGHLSK